jgi:hypothetical protein
VRALAEDAVKLSEVFVNETRPPHSSILKGGYGSYDPATGKLEIAGADTILQMPHEHEEYFVGSNQKNFPDARCTGVMDSDGPFLFREHGR